MRPVVLDTDASSQILKNRLTGPLATGLVGATWCVTFVTVAELWQWAEVRHWGIGPGISSTTGSAVSSS